MKKGKLIILAAVAVASLGVACLSCSKDEANDDNTGTNGGGNGGVSSSEWVDLGLPSGLKWASCNVGANKPEGFGNYYAWGETQTKNTYDWDTYIYAVSELNTELKKYCNDPEKGYNGYTDDLTVLLAEDDAASANIGNGARTPTKEEWDELLGNCTHTWTSLNGVAGLLFTGSNGNSIFLPASGYIFDAVECLAGGQGFYWSSSLCLEEPAVAWSFEFTDWNADTFDGGLGRKTGYTIRPVK